MLPAFAGFVSRGRINRDLEQGCIRIVLCTGVLTISVLSLPDSIPAPCAQSAPTMSKEIRARLARQDSGDRNPERAFSAFR